jgi:hypothetical protein
MLCTIPFESFNLFMVKSSYYNFLLRNVMDGMHKMLELNSIFL